MVDDTRQANVNHGGRASSWLAVTVLLLGFGIAGVALCMGPNWFVFWMGAGACAMGGILVLVFGVFQDVVLDAPRTMHAGTSRNTPG
ncbi:hypothetical protein FHS43_000980 [Streptosporangium becharense]|uniref:Uncharacterized protein n=1 Tax=Streptosporangium becharense TaxID=1816182 RepID=A0A7W9MFZ0_9ACTN|nr:HGxxPAAW family protein [Streptosporangium becharense]MBB2909734.1 hypothetical protein [Streptosporangium becharense]MBB5819310.1 hypothetical protein [Streptosporangium becharense]